MKNIIKRFKDSLIYLVKGMAIGVAMIIPGVSGGTLAVLLGIYDKMIDSINNLFKHPKKSISVLLPILLGAGLGFIALIYPLSLGLTHCPLIVISLFAGLIIGGIPSLYKTVQGKESIKGFIFSLLSLILMVVLCFIVPSIDVDLSSLNAGIWFYLLLGGILSAVALVIPGISGSMILMILGLYTPILLVLKETLSFVNLFDNILIILPVGLGVLLGFFSIAKLMGFLLKKHPIHTYFTILGFVVGSIFTIYYVTITDSEYLVSFDPLSIIISVVCLIGGFLLTFLLEKNLKNLNKENNNETR